MDLSTIAIDCPSFKFAARGAIVLNLCSSHHCELLSSLKVHKSIGTWEFVVQFSVSISCACESGLDADENWLLRTTKLAMTLKIMPHRGLTCRANLMIVCSTGVPMSSSSFMRQRKSTRVSNLEKAKLLHEYAESNKGEFPTPRHVHPEYPEWKWGSWIDVLLTAYLNNSLDANVKAYIEGNVHWRSRIEKAMNIRGNKGRSMPNPEHHEKAKLLHDYAQNNQGEFPTRKQVHPVYPEWKWGTWVPNVLHAYFTDSLDENTKAYMEGSVHWRSRIEKV